MPLTVGTDTYIDLADATAYLADFGPDGAEVDESALKRATLAIDRLWGGTFTGARSVSTQALEFPRDGSTEIPLCVQHATAELAYLISTGTDPYTQPTPLVTEETIKLDVITESRKFHDTGYRTNFLHKIKVILGPVLAGSSFGVMFANVVRG